MAAAWSRERSAALAGAILLTVALPIAIDQGYFRYSPYALPTLGAVAVLLYLGFFLTSPRIIGIAKKLCQRPVSATIVFVASVGLVTYLFGTAWHFALRKSKEHVAEIWKKENPSPPVIDKTPSEESKKQPSKVENPPATKRKSESPKDSLVINALAGYGNYAEGSKIGSIDPITWKNYYSEVTVIFVNTSSDDYDAFDVSIDPDQVIFAASQMTVVPGVFIFSPSGGPGTQLPPPEETKPLPPNSVLLLPNNIDSSPRRVRCERFPARVPMRLIFAVANVKFPPGTKHGHALMFGFGTPDLNPKALPQWVKIEGSYKLQGQKFPISKTVKFTQAPLP